VVVLREALTRDDVERRKRQKHKITKAQAGKPVKTFIQHVHHFRKKVCETVKSRPANGS
jgi:hypothetical protein